MHKTKIQKYRNDRISALKFLHMTYKNKLVTVVLYVYMRLEIFKTSLTDRQSINDLFSRTIIHMHKSRSKKNWFKSSYRMMDGKK